MQCFRHSAIAPPFCLPSLFSSGRNLIFLFHSKVDGAEASSLKVDADDETLLASSLASFATAKVDGSSKQVLVDAEVAGASGGNSARGSQRSAGIDQVQLEIAMPTMCGLVVSAFA